MYQIDFFVVAELAPYHLFAFKANHAPLVTYGLASYRLDYLGQDYHIDKT